MSFAEDCSGLKAIALSKLKCQLEELQQHNTDLSADNQRLKDKNCALQQACDESLAKQSALQLAHRQQVSQLEDAVHVLKQQLGDACSSAEEQQGQVAAARQEVNAVLAGRERRCQELRAEVAALKQQLAAKTTDAEILSRRVGAVNSLTTAFEQELEALQQGMRHLQDRVGQQDGVIKQHERRLLEVVQTGEGLSKQLQEQGELLQAAQQQVKDQQAASQAAEVAHAEVIKGLERQLRQAQEHLDESNAKAVSLEDKLQQEQQQTKQQAEAHLQDLNTLTQQLQQATADQAAAQAATALLAEQSQQAAAAAIAQAALIQSQLNAAVVGCVVTVQAHHDLLLSCTASIKQAQAAATHAVQTTAAEATAAAKAAAAELAAMKEALAAASLRAEAAEEAEAVAQAEAAAAVAAAAASSHCPAAAAPAANSPTSTKAADSNHSHMPQQHQQQRVSSTAARPSSGSKRCRDPTHTQCLKASSPAAPDCEPGTTAPAAAGSRAEAAAGAANATSPTLQAAGSPPQTDTGSDEPPATRRCLEACGPLQCSEAAGAAAVTVGAPGATGAHAHSMQHQQQQPSKRPPGSALSAMSALGASVQVTQHSSMHRSSIKPSHAISTAYGDASSSFSGPDFNPAHTLAPSSEQASTRVWSSVGWRQQAGPNTTQGPQNGPIYRSAAASYRGGAELGHVGGQHVSISSSGVVQLPKFVPSRQAMQQQQQYMMHLKQGQQYHQGHPPQQQQPPPPPPQQQQQRMSASKHVAGSYAPTCAPPAASGGPGPVNSFTAVPQQQIHAEQQHKQQQKLQQGTAEGYRSSNSSGGRHDQASESIPDPQLRSSTQRGRHGAGPHHDAPVHAEVAPDPDGSKLASPTVQGLHRTGLTAPTAPQELPEVLTATGMDCAVPGTTAANSTSVNSEHAGPACLLGTAASPAAASKASAALRLAGSNPSMPQPLDSHKQQQEVQDGAGQEQQHSASTEAIAAATTSGLHTDAGQRVDPATGTATARHSTASHSMANPGASLSTAGTASSPSKAQLGNALLSQAAAAAQESDSSQQWLRDQTSHVQLAKSGVAAAGSLAAAGSAATGNDQPGQMAVAGAKAAAAAAVAGVSAGAGREQPAVARTTMGMLFCAMASDESDDE